MIVATSEDYIAFVCDLLRGIENITCRKMFGEYLAYASGKPVLLVCDNTVMVKKLTEQAVALLEEITPLPKRRKKG